MTDTAPNEQQARLIDADRGVYVVDAGAGTGKTYTITRRYAALLEQADLAPEDILLVTFTNNAATEMKERVVARSDYPMSALRDAPISTFHGWCHELLLEHGVFAPRILGIDDQLTASTRLLEDEVLEAERFRAFLRRFIDAHPEHHDLLRIQWDRENLLGLIKQLAAKGVFPTADGWFRNGERHLDGDLAAFEALFDAANETDGSRQSALRASLSGWDRSRCHPPDAPDELEVRGERGTKRLDRAWARRAFEEDRTALKAFVHDVYHGYIAFALRRNYLNFPFLQMFAFALLCADHDLRESVRYEHVMVDEFQDTSEIQFKLALLLAGAGNLCVVGDWKQSIYGFQYASVDNIRRFEERLATYRTELNDDHERVPFPVDDVTEISLVENYRSTQAILDFSEQSLTLPGTRDEEVDPAIADEITSLEAATDHDHSVIEAFTSEEEVDAVLERIQRIVGSDRYLVEDDAGELVPPTFGDIAVLTRKRRFGRELQSRADELEVPMAYEGGVELFETPQAILLLAWLRILEDGASRRGWSVVLEEAGYTLDEIAAILDDGAPPGAFVAFRERLRALETVGGVAREVLDRYGFDDAYADALVRVVQGTFDETTGNRGELVRYIEGSLEAGATHEVSDTPGGDAVTVQTIHAAKGLQHPIVIVADMNANSFPASGGGFAARIRFADPIGLRQTKRYREVGGRPHLFDDWRHHLLSACLGGEYDEERRLLYVAMTRAESHLLFSAGADPGRFFEGLSLAPETVEPDPSPSAARPTERSPLRITVPAHAGPVGLTPHSLMDEGVFEDVEEGRGRAFGDAVHEFAERYARGEAVTPANEDQRHVRAFVDALEGEAVVEEWAHLPLSLDGETVRIAGIIDLLHLTDGAAQIVDYKTDLGRHAQSEYRKQLSVYHRVVSRVYPDRAVTAGLFYTATGELVEVEPLSEAALAGLVRSVVRGGE